MGEPLVLGEASNHGQHRRNVGRSRRCNAEFVHAPESFGEGMRESAMAIADSGEEA